MTSQVVAIDRPSRRGQLHAVRFDAITRTAGHLQAQLASTSTKFVVCFLVSTVCLLSAGCVSSGSPSETANAAAIRRTPAADHHKHLMGSAISSVANGADPHTEIHLPPELAALTEARVANWNSSTRLAELFSEDAVSFADGRQGWIYGRAQVIARLGRIPGPYRFVPSGLRQFDGYAEITGYYVREGTSPPRYLTQVLLIARIEDDRWRIVTEVPRPIPPNRYQGTTADELIAVMDRAGVQRSVVLSEGFWADGPLLVVSDPYERMVAENEWTAQEVSRYPNRLIAFCSFNPVAEHSQRAFDSCASNAVFRGLKFSFAMSAVDLKNPEHLRRVTEVFAAANRRGLPIVVHLRGGDDYGRDHVRLFLDQVMAAAPDITVQIAHLWGGEAYSEEALAALAEAVETGHPGTRNLYFDIAESTLNQPASTLDILAQRIRQIGPERILFGTDGMDPALAWRSFRGGVPLTEAEFAIISQNVAPYLQ